jgi:antitoxin component YwqK of YwqJK toxin-antitoxin module
MRNILILLFFFSFNELFSQEIIGIKEVYIENNLVYKNASDELFTGIAQSKRKNGHLVYEEEYKNGIILSSNLYYNGKEKRVSNKITYNPNKPLVLSKEHKYNLESEIFETTTYNDDGVKILVEQFKNRKLTYSCQYLGKKKNGLQLGYAENGEKLTYRCEFTNGKKNGTEYCLNEDGTETKKEYQNGKKIK